MKNHDFGENSVEVKFSQEIDFLRVEDPQNPFGSCAARNVQNFGGVKCSTEKCDVVMVQACSRHDSCTKYLIFNSTWLVETVIFKGRPSASNIFLAWRQNLKFQGC